MTRRGFEKEKETRRRARSARSLSVRLVAPGRVVGMGAARAHGVLGVVTVMVSTYLKAKEWGGG